MDDAAAGAHHLHVTGFGTAFVAQAVLVGNGAFADIGDDFHVAVWVLRKTGTGGDHVIVPHPQVAPVHAAGVMVLGEREMVMGVEPSVVGATQGCERSELDHGALLKWKI